MQSHLECRLWNEIFVDAQKALVIPNGAPGMGCGAAADRLRVWSAPPPLSCGQAKYYALGTPSMLARV